VGLTGLGNRPRGAGQYGASSVRVRMPLIAQGTKIVCTKAHVFGTVAQDIPDAQTIAAQDLDLGADVAMHINPRSDGHRCRSCGERVTHYQDGAYQIRTAGGWRGPQT
jgi:hypothetical protein